jgi:hypothetical protein
MRRLWRPADPAAPPLQPTPGLSSLLAAPELGQSVSSADEGGSDLSLSGGPLLSSEELRAAGEEGHKSSTGDAGFQWSLTPCCWVCHTHAQLPACLRRC